MSIEVIVFIYIYICVCVSLFDFLFIGYIKHNQKTAPKAEKQLENLLRQQSDFIFDYGETDGKLQKKIFRKMCAITNLTAYSELFKKEANEDFIYVWLQNSTDILADLTLYYAKRPSEERAFWAYLLSTTNLKVMMVRSWDASKNIDNIAEVLIDFIYDHSVYVRENSFKAILRIGEAKYVVSALLVLNELSRHQSEKLITDNLLSFIGSHTELAAGVWKEFSELEGVLQLSFINYMRLVRDKRVPHKKYYEEFYRLLESRNTEKEVRLALIRYFRNYPYAPVYELLLSFVTSTNNLMWSYAAVAATTLSAYPGESTQKALLTALSSRNWYLRLNAAENLIAQGISEEEFENALGDSFAREMIAYRMQINKQKEESRLKEHD